ncbi:MAG: hypothetical protein LZF62_340140 [Nitrospira sp.]|nr:MAG: hypothetical protein LZF62_340140 [Nitrospira sp.]
MSILRKRPEIRRRLSDRPHTAGNRVVSFQVDARIGQGVPLVADEIALGKMIGADWAQSLRRPIAGHLRGGA